MSDVDRMRRVLRSGAHVFAGLGLMFGGSTVARCISDGLDPSRAVLLLTQVLGVAWLLWTAHKLRP